MCFRRFLWQLALVAAILGGSGLFQVTPAQDYGRMSRDQLEQELARLTAEITTELIRVNDYLVRYDEALGIGVASGMVDRDTATRQLQARGRELYDRSFTDANYRQLLEQHRVATQSYLAQVENAVRNAQTWPDPEAAEEYRQLALSELGNLRAEYDSLMNQGRDPMAVLVDAAEIMYWTSGQRNLPPTQNPFAGAYQRAAAALPDASLQQQLTDLDARRWREPERPRPMPIPLSQTIQQALSGVPASGPVETSPPQPQVSTPAPGDLLGTVWYENESGWSGRWTRRGSSNVFDALWTYGASRVTAVLTIQIQGDTVLVSRYQSSDANDCNYSGRLASDRRSVSGTYSCSRFTGVRNWEARLGEDIPVTLGTVWRESESGWSGVWTRRGSSNVFDALWTYGAGRVTAVLTIQIQGDTVLISRYQSSDGNDCGYTGQLGADRRSVSGTYSCSRFRGTRSWQATIQP